MLYFPLVPCCVGRGPQDPIGFGETIERTALPHTLYRRSGDLNLHRPLPIHSFPPSTLFFLLFPFELQYCVQVIYYFKGGMGSLLLLTPTKNVVISYLEPQFPHSIGCVSCEL